MNRKPQTPSDGPGRKKGGEVGLDYPGNASGQPCPSDAPPGEANQQVLPGLDTLTGESIEETQARRVEEAVNRFQERVKQGRFKPRRRKRGML